MIKAAGILKHGVRCYNQSKRRHHLWTSSEIRRSFVDFFIGKDHLFVPSSSVVASKNDGSYFVNAGMNQFKPLFLGTADTKTEMASYKRVTNYQKCIRVGGKHNDLDDVGQDHYHHTFFEMLGNWSFNDYGKIEACKMAWELLTKVYKIPEERLFVTYFKGDEDLNLKADTTCKAIWLDIGVPDHQILPFGSKDNFWVMGETGPCGPCTEIHYCHQENIREGRTLVNAGSNDVLEIWNLVFMEYDRRPDGSLMPLPRKHIDTGMGLERLTALLNNSTSNYDTDLFQGLFSHIQKSCNSVPYGQCLTDPIDKAYRIVADHSRMFTVTIGDGLLPGRKESEGKLRTVMYKSLYQANEILRAPRGFLKSMVPVVIESLSDAYPNLSSHQNMIMDVVQETEERYLESIATGRKLMKKAMLAFGNVDLLTGDQILQIQEGKFGRGISFDIISLLAEEFHVSLDAEDFETKLKLSQNNHAKARESSKPLFDQHDVNFLEENGVKPTADQSHKITTYSEAEHCYKFPLVKGKVVALKIGEEFVSEVQAGSLDCGVILDETAFYAEGGGQVSDTGELLVEPLGKLYGKVSDVTRCGGYIFHRIGRVENNIQLGDVAYASVNAEHRTRCMANHTATHIILYALEKVLGRVRQQGSLVNDNHLTFDFSCLKSQVTPEDLKKVVKIIKEIMLGKYVVSQFVAPLKDVTRAKHLFKLENENYPSDVKVVSIAKYPRNHKDPKFYEEQPEEHVSLQLCGGTHVTDTDHIQELVITNLDGSVQGTKRLTAVTRDFAKQALDNYDMLKKKVEAIAELQNTKEIINGMKCVDKLLSELVLPKLDREKILKRMTKINFDISQNRKSLLLSDIGQSIEDEIAKKTSGSENGPMVLEIPFEKSRDVIGGLLAVNAQQPLFLLSKSQGPVHMGVAYIPKDFNQFQSKHWAEHICEQLGGEHFPPKGKHSKHNISLIKIPIKGDWEKEASEIVRVAEKFLTAKKNFQKQDSDVVM